MEHHALAFLQEAEAWNWPAIHRIQKSGQCSGRHAASASRLLSQAIVQSTKLGGGVLNRFWAMLEECDSRLKQNVVSLRTNAEFVPAEKAINLLMKGIVREDIDFGKVLNMAEEIFTHLVVAFMNPGGRKSGGDTGHSVDDLLALESDALVKIAKAGDQVGKRRQAALKQLSYRRDGRSCLLTGLPFNDEDGVLPTLAHVIPNSFCDKHKENTTVRLIAMFSGLKTEKLVLGHLNSIGNVMNLETNAHVSFDALKWGIEAKEEDDGKITYIYRRVPSKELRSPGIIRLRDGDEIKFGGGREGETLKHGPLPLLCNLHLAVARIARMSGAAEVITEWMNEADDSDIPHVYVASEDYCNILTAKLLLVGAR